MDISIIHRYVAVFKIKKKEMKNSVKVYYSKPNFEEENKTL